MDDFAEKILISLAGHILDNVPTVGSTRSDVSSHYRHDGCIFDISMTDKQKAVRLILDQDLTIAIRKSECPPVDAEGTFDEISWADAIAEIEIAFDVSVGNVNLSAADIQNLEGGDIIVLDKASDTPLELKDAAGRLLCHVKTAQVGGNISLKAINAGD
ncbi:FliM/FliN family flagellar motor switch protein [Sphingorhabdus arenilitoris]|uniref:FliM/FliN family flagellar motor switch protein n=1 Tax=Sphingorhabdus arenilitoris TaxID=1490041 RepID=A0ABV8RDS3_9SPHN